MAPRSSHAAPPSSSSPHNVAESYSSPSPQPTLSRAWPSPLGPLSSRAASHLQRCLPKMAGPEADSVAGADSVAAHVNAIFNSLRDGSNSADVAHALRAAPPSHPAASAVAGAGSGSGSGADAPHHTPSPPHAPRTPWTRPPRAMPPPPPPHPPAPPSSSSPPPPLSGAASGAMAGSGSVMPVWLDTAAMRCCRCCRYLRCRYRLRRRRCHRRRRSVARIAHATALDTCGTWSWLHAVIGTAAYACMSPACA